MSEKFEGNVPPQEHERQEINYPQFEITPGTEALDAKFKPTDLGVGEYFIPNALGHSEHEDLAARIIKIGQNEGKFVAPSYRTIAEQIISEIDEARKREDAQRAKHAEMPTKTLVQSIKTGLTRLLRREQAAAQPIQQKQAEEKPMPFSVLAFNCRFNPQVLPSEIRGMIDKGYLNLVNKDENDFLEPTEKLVEEIVAAQQSREK